jgi:hypothetical protein
MKHRVPFIVTELGADTDLTKAAMKHAKAKGVRIVGLRAKGTELEPGSHSLSILRLDLL